MAKAKFRCRNPKYKHEFEREDVIISPEEMREWMRRNPGKKPGKIVCPICGSDVDRIR